MSRDCDESLTKLYLYLDAELDDANSEKIRFHLEACTDCFHSFDFERRLKRVVRDNLNEECPDEVVERIRSAIARESQAP